MTRTALQHNRGAAILGMLISLVIIFILVSIFFGFDPVTGTTVGPSPQQQLSRVRSTVCDANRVTLRSDVIMATMDRGRLTPDIMVDALGSKKNACPGTGCYYVTSTDHLYCTEHSPTPKFSEMLEL